MGVPSKHDSFGGSPFQRSQQWPARVSVAPLDPISLKVSQPPLDFAPICCSVNYYELVKIPSVVQGILIAGFSDNFPGSL
jgi:hypothetical protein